MDEFLDSLWDKIEVFILYLKGCLDAAFAPLDIFGPAVAISTIALTTVLITKILSKIYKTKRYAELQKQFFYWLRLREEATKNEDKEKGKLLARNIDQAKLNKVYYDYFFEGLLGSLFTKYLPVFIVLAYVNEAYRPGNLLRRFGQSYVFSFGSSRGEGLVVGAVFWFVLSIVLVYVCWFIVSRLYRKYISRTDPGLSR